MLPFRINVNAIRMETLQNSRLIGGITYMGIETLAK